MRIRLYKIKDRFYILKRTIIICFSIIICCFILGFIYNRFSSMDGYYLEQGKKVYILHNDCQETSVSCDNSVYTLNICYHMKNGKNINFENFDYTDLILDYTGMTLQQINVIANSYWSDDTKIVNLSDNVILSKSINSKDTFYNIVINGLNRDEVSKYINLDKLKE